MIAKEAFNGNIEDNRLIKAWDNLKTRAMSIHNGNEAERKKTGGAQCGRIIGQRKKYKFSFFIFVEIFVVNEKYRIFSKIYQH